MTVTTPTFRKHLSGVMWGLSLRTCLWYLQPFWSRQTTDRQTDQKRPIRNDSVVNGDHAHLLNTRHTTPDIAANWFKRFYSLSNAANAVHWKDKNDESLHWHCTNERRVRKWAKKVRRDVIQDKSRRWR